MSAPSLFLPLCLLFFIPENLLSQYLDYSLPRSISISAQISLLRELFLFVQPKIASFLALYPLILPIFFFVILITNFIHLFYIYFILCIYSFCLICFSIVFPFCSVLLDDLILNCISSLIIYNCSSHELLPNRLLHDYRTIYVFLAPYIFLFLSSLTSFIFLVMYYHQLFNFMFKG